MTYIIAIVLIILALLLAYFFRFIIGKTFDAFSFFTPLSENSNNAGVKSKLNNQKNDSKKESLDENLENNLSDLYLGVANQREQSSYAEMWEIAGEYGDCIPTKSTIPGIYPNSVLPYPREEIKRALATLLLMENSPVAKEIICINYDTLDKFVPDEIYRIMADTFGEPNPEDTQQNLDVMVETSINKINKDIIETWEKTMNLLREREYSSTIELLALRRIAGLDVETYLKRLNELGRQETEVDQNLK